MDSQQNPNGFSPYTAHDEMMRAIGRLEGKVDGIGEQMTQVVKIASDQETRLLAVEKEQSSIKGKVAIIGGLAGLMVGSIWNFFWNKVAGK